MDAFAAALAGADTTRSVQDRAAEAVKAAFDRADAVVAVLDRDADDAMESLALACEVDWSVSEIVGGILDADHLSIPARLRAIQRVAATVAERDAAPSASFEGFRAGPDYVEVRDEAGRLVSRVACLGDGVCTNPRCPRHGISAEVAR